ncbi:hypothetical protein G6F66_002055 [Rhizopus arrhizus]|nr:hypothetical protein G6F66_002055 [Rhizopus arrhizus]
MLTTCQRSFLQFTRFIHSQKWLPWEDDLLKKYVQHNGKKWSEIVQHCLPHRSQKQCQIRWVENLNPNIKTGPFSESERQILQKAVAKVGTGHWAEISQAYLPHRTPRRIANEWTGRSRQRVAWTEEEDGLLLEGVERFGLKAWTKIAETYLPHRTRSQVRARYRQHLAPDVIKDAWSEQELDLLLRRTIMYGQEDWNKVAEGIQGRLPEQCQIKWTTEMDPGLNKAAWSKEETRLFWQHLIHAKGQLVKAAQEMPGRSNLSCLQKFNATLRDKELVAFHSDELKRTDTENVYQWRQRIASLVCHWLDQQPAIKLDSKQGLQVYRQGPWDRTEIEQLKAWVDQEGQDWQAISKQMNRSPSQCRVQFEQHLSKQDIKRGFWTAKEDAALLAAVETYGTSDWSQVAAHVPFRTKIQCASRYRRVLRYPQNITGKPLTSAEKLLVWEGYQMFGPNWQAIQMTYLPAQTKPEHIMRWWNHRKPKSKEDLFGRQGWSEEEDKALSFSIQQSTSSEGIDWRSVSNMMQDRSAKQCQKRWEVSLDPSVKRGRWDSEEVLRLIELVQKKKIQTQQGSMWPEVAKALGTNRSEHACRYKYYSMQRKGSRFVT